MLVGDTYYMYATSSKSGIFVWKGSELDKLSLVGLCYKREDSFGYECFWAPEVVRRADGKYVMHMTARDRADGVLRTGVAISDSPEGPFIDAVRGKPMFDVGTATIDASCLIDGERAYLFFVKDCSTNIVDGVHTSQIFAAELDRSLTKLTSEPVLVSTPDKPWERKILGAPTEGLLKKGKTDPGGFLWNEGPSVVKHGDKYYLTYSCNCFDSRDYSVGFATAGDPLGPYTKFEGNPILKYIDGEISGPGHNSFFLDKSGRLMTAFHIHTDYDRPSGDRRFCYCPVEFEGEVMKFLYK